MRHASTNWRRSRLIRLRPRVPSDIAQVLGTAADYTVTEVADRNVGIVAKLNRQRLSGLTQAKQ